MKAVFVFGCLLVATISLGQQQDAPGPKGTIYGVAVGNDGQPAKHVGLTAEPLVGILAAVLPHTTTDDNGEFRLDVPWWGKYTVFAEDEDAGYSTFSTGGFGQSDPASVEIMPGRREAEVRVNLPPKAAFLRVHLTNRKTGDTIASMSISVMRDTHPPALAFSISCYSTRVVLLPPDKDLLIHVTSNGFREWNESVGKGKLLHLGSGEHVTLEVALDPAQ